MKVTKFVYMSVVLGTILALIGCPDEPGPVTNGSYTCANGTVASGSPDGSSDVERCASCSTGYRLSSNNVCETDVVQFSGPEPDVPSGSSAGFLRIVRFENGDGIGIGIFSGENQNDIVSYDSDANGDAQWRLIDARSVSTRDTSMGVLNAYYTQAVGAGTAYYSTWNEVFSYTVHEEEDVSVAVNSNDSHNVTNIWYFTTGADPGNNIWGNNNSDMLFSNSALVGSGGSFQDFIPVHDNDDTGSINALPEVVDSGGTSRVSNIVGNLLFDDTTLWVGGEEMVWSGVMSEDTIAWTGYTAYDSDGDPVLMHRAFANLNGVIHAMGEEGHLFRLNADGSAFEYITQIDLGERMEAAAVINHSHYLIATSNESLVAWRSGYDTVVRSTDSGATWNNLFTATEARDLAGQSSGTRTRGFFINGQVIGNTLYITYIYGGDDGATSSYSIGMSVE